MIGALRVRPARGEDLAAVVAIGEAEAGLSLPPSRYEQLLRDAAAERAQFLVAEGEGRVLGFSVCDRVLDEATLLAMAVEPAWRRQGIGQRLLAATLAGLAGAPVDRCLLEVRASNTAAIGLYRRNGFLEDGRRRHYYPGRGTLDREDAVLMSFPLEQVHAGTGD